jgi:uncharacterized protein (DUF433 family)
LDADDSAASQQLFGAIRFPCIDGEQVEQNVGVEKYLSAGHPRLNGCAFLNLLMARNPANLHTMLDWSSCPAVERDPDRVSGAWVFRGTRVPVKALFENLESGARIDDFLAWFPGVTREMVEAVLEHTQRSLQTEAH